MWYSWKFTGIKLWDQQQESCWLSKYLLSMASSYGRYTSFRSSLKRPEETHVSTPYEGHEPMVNPLIPVFSSYPPPDISSSALKMANPINKPSCNSEYPDPEGSIKECAIILPLCNFVNVSLNNDCYLAWNAVYPEVHSLLRSCLLRRVQAQLWNSSPRRTFVLLLMQYCTELCISSCDMLSDEDLPSLTFRYPQPIPKPILIVVRHFRWIWLRIEGWVHSARQKVLYNTVLPLAVANSRCLYGKYKNMARI